MPKANSNQKGKRGERELASFLREYGYNAYRSQQYSGANHDADIEGGPNNLHIECKRTERLQLYDALDQAKADKRDEEIPVVFHRRNNHEWVTIMRATDFMEMYRRAYDD